MRLIKDKRGLELVWWTMIVFVLAIIVLLIFYYFIRGGFIQIETLSWGIFGAPDQFAKNTTIIANAT